MNNLLLEVKNLTVKLEENIILENISFKVKEGEILTILGQNGIGKSVLIKALLGLLPYTGEIIWHRKPKIGYLPQGLNQIMTKGLPLTVQDFFMLKNSSPTVESIIKFLELVGLPEDILLKKTGVLSSGQFQRMLVAWVLISRPEVILLDEPITGIDIGGEDTIYSLLEQIQKKRKLTIFIVTHDLNIVYIHSTNVLCLSREKHTCFGHPKEILNSEMLKNIFGRNIKFYEHDK